MEQTTSSNKIFNDVIEQTDQIDQTKQINILQKQNEILELTKEMNLAIKEIKNIYSDKINKINKLIDGLRVEEFKLKLLNFKLFDKLMSDQFNDWWILYLKIYDNNQIYVDNNNKLYILNDANSNDTGTIKPIDIINNFPLNIKKLTFCDIITIDFDHKKTYRYIYSDNEITSFWIYDDKIKKWSIYDDKKKF